MENEPRENIQSNEQKMFDKKKVEEDTHRYRM